MFSNMGRFFKRNSQSNNARKKSNSAKENTDCQKNNSVKDNTDCHAPSSNVLAPSSGAHEKECEKNHYLLQQGEILKFKDCEQTHHSRESLQRQKLERIIANLPMEEEQSEAVDKMINFLYKAVVDKNREEKKIQGKLLASSGVEEQKVEEKEFRCIPYVSKQSILVVNGKQKGRAGYIQKASDGRAKIAVGVDVQMANGEKKGFWMPITFIVPYEEIVQQIMSSKCVSMTNMTENEQLAVIMTHQQQIIPYLHLGDYESFKQVGDGNPEQFDVVVKTTHQSHTNPNNRHFYLDSHLPEDVKLYDIGSELYDVDDIWNSHFTHVLDKILPDIKKHLQARQRILVHCTQGQSRAPTVVIAYLMWQYRVPYEKAFAFVQSKRLQVKPKDAFVEGLKAKYRL